MPVGECDSCDKKFKVPEAGKKYRCKCGGTVMAAEAEPAPPVEEPEAEEQTQVKETPEEEKPRRSRAKAKPAKAKRGSRRSRAAKDEDEEEEQEQEEKPRRSNAGARGRSHRSEARVQAEARKKKQKIIIAAVVVVLAVVVVYLLSTFVKAPGLEDRVLEFQQVWNATGGADDREGIGQIGMYFLETDKMTLSDKLKKRFILDKWVHGKPELSNPRCKEVTDFKSSDWWLSGGLTPVGEFDDSSYKGVGVVFDAKFGGATGVQSINFIRDNRDEWRIAQMYKISEFRRLPVVVKLFAEAWNGAENTDEAINFLSQFGHSADKATLKERLTSTFNKRGWKDKRPMIEPPALASDTPESPCTLEFSIVGGGDPIKVMWRQSSDFWLLKEVN